MFAPKSVRNADTNITQELKDEQLRVMREVLWNKELSDEQANILIDEFNLKWIEAGGTKGGCIIRR